jgi:hypothetical protein
VNKLMASFLTLCTMTACMAWTHEDAMRLWAEHRDTTVLRKKNIEDYLNPRSAVNLLGIKEVQPNVMEYSFEYKNAKWFTPAEAKCRFIMSVEKGTGSMIGWKYNGNPNYCTDNP